MFCIKGDYFHKSCEESGGEYTTYLHTNGKISTKREQKDIYKSERNGIYKVERKVSTR